MSVQVPQFNAQFRFYEELNDFLPQEKRKQTIYHVFDGRPSVKDPIEVLGVPHTEIDLILANGHSVGFDYHLQNNDRVAVYPVFESFDISPLVKLRGKPLRCSTFVVGAHLRKLAKSLQLLGFDAKYWNDYSDPQIVNIAINERRIVLTRDRRLLYAKAVTHGYGVRSHDPKRQLQEVLERFDLYSQIGRFNDVRDARA